MRIEHFLAAAAFAMASGCAGAREAAIPRVPTSADCTLKHPSRDVDSLKKLPPDIRAALTKLAGGMADRGEFFNAGDVVVKPGPFNRFIRAGETQGFWYVWYEHGGIAFWHQIVLFGVDPSGGVHTAANEISRNADLCVATDALLDGKHQ